MFRKTVRTNMFVVQFEKLHEQPSVNLFERPGAQRQVPTSRFWHQFQQPFCVYPQLTVILTFRKGKATHLILSSFPTQRQASVHQLLVHVLVPVANIHVKALMARILSGFSHSNRNLTLSKTRKRSDRFSSSAHDTAISCAQAHQRDRKFPPF